MLSASQPTTSAPRAIAVLFDLAHDITRAREEDRDVGAAQATVKELAGVLGLTLEEGGRDGSEEVGPLVELLIESRAELRAAKLYDKADQVRDRLADLGYLLEDTPRGTEWKRRGR